jgi:hypothetical protein
LPSARVYMQQILYDKFSYDKFDLLVWTCQQVYFDNLLVASNVIVQRTTRALANHIIRSDYFDKFSLLTHTDEQNLYFDNFFYDKCTCSKATILAKIMWTPNFPNAKINIETFFHEICRPLPPIQCCFPHLNFKSFIYQHWIGGRRGRNFLRINSVEIHLFLFDARGVHNNFCQDCSMLAFEQVHLS